MTEVKIGRVSHFFGKIGVAAIELTDGDLKIGDTIHIKGKTSDSVLKIDSIQVDHQPKENAKKGESVGLKLAETARENDTVFLIVEN